MKPSLLLFALLLAVPAFAQKRMQIPSGCAFDTDVKDLNPYIFDADPQAQQIVAEICGALGIQQNFQLQSADVKNALACERDGQRYILYNTDFLKEFQSDARSKWAAYGVLAHEIGHHLNFHNFKEENAERRKELELQADGFAGSVLRLLGATKDEAKTAVSNLVNKTETATHPPPTARNLSVVNGWNDQDQRLRKMGITGVNNTAVEKLIKNRKSGLIMKAVEGGSFTMGSPTAESGRGDDECQHQVTVAPYKIGYYEVTQADWKEVMGSYPEELNFRGCADCPVEQVSWDDIQQFLTKLNEKTGQRYRLPTETEWEYAARGGKQSKGYLYAGGNTLNDVAWYKDNAASQTHPVGGKQANELGLYDMSGNVYEWCQDTYKPYPCDRSTKANDSVRVSRGGSWGGFITYGFRSAVRNNVAPTSRGNVLGFRLAQD